MYLPKQIDLLIQSARIVYDNLVSWHVVYKVPDKYTRSTIEVWSA